MRINLSAQFEKEEEEEEAIKKAAWWAHAQTTPKR